MSLIKKLAGETALYGLSSIVGRFLNVMLAPLYTNILDQSEYGIVISFYANAAFLMVLYSYRMESAFFKFGTPQEDRDNTYTTGVWSLICSTLLLLAAVEIFAQPIAEWLRYPGHADYVQLFGLMLAFDCLAELPFARLRLEQKPIRFAVGKLFNIGLNLTLNLFWVLFCPWAYKNGFVWVRHVWNPAFGIGYIFLSQVIANAATLLYLAPQFKAILRGKFILQLWLRMLRYAGPLILVSMAGIVNETLDRAILTYLLPGTHDENLAQVGIYGASYKLAMMITLFTQAYRYAAEPFFFRNAGHKDALQIQADAAKWFTIAASVGMLGILLFIDLAKYFIGPKFWSGLGVVPILLLANVFLGIYYNFSVWYRLKDKTDIGAWISIAGALVTIILNVVFAPVYGYMASAWATLACYAFMSWITWHIGRKHYPVPYPIGNMLFHMGLAMAFYGASELFRNLLAGHPVGIWSANIALFLGYLGVIARIEDLRQFIRPATS